MFFGLVALVGLALALVTRRPLLRLAETDFRHLEVLWLAIGLHLLFVPDGLAPLLGVELVPGLPPLGGLLYVTSLILLAVFTWINRHAPGVALIGLGLLLNALVIASNGGQMPVDPQPLAAIGSLEEAREAASDSRWSSFSVMHEGTRLAFLGDHLLVPMPLRDPVILSLGDLAIAAGILLFFLVIPGRTPSPQPPRLDAS